VSEIKLPKNSHFRLRSLYPVGKKSIFPPPPTITSALYS
jgi:hypothetical protein